MRYNVGPRTYELATNYCAETQNAQISDGRLEFNPGGRAVYDFYLIFNAMSVDFTYSASADVTLTIECGNENPYIAELPAAANGKVTFSFADALGEAYSEPKGERIFEFTASSDLSLSKILFNKEKIQTVKDYDELFLCELTDDEEAIQTSVLVDQTASILIVNGARRYINTDDSSEVCLTYNSRIYLPVHTLARALGYYYEDAPEKMYTLMRHNDFEYCFTPTESYKLNFSDEEREEVTDLRVYKNGRTYLPLRIFAEALGKTVDYKNGIAVIDDKFTVAEIMKEHYEYVGELFSPFREGASKRKVYYVAQTENASDKNDGSIDAPFKTLAKASGVAAAGDTVIVREGVYREVLKPQNDGLPTLPVVFKAKEGERVVLSAAEEIGGFSTQDGSVYTAPIGWDLGDGRNQVFYEDDSLIEARYPNISNVGEDRALLLNDPEEPYSPLWPVAGDFKVSLQDNTVVTSDTLLNQTEEDYWKGAYFVSMHGHGWALANARVTGSSYGQLTLGNTSKYFWPDPSENEKWSYGYLAGHINALDTYGEWIIDNGKIHLIPPEDADTDYLTVEVKKRQLVADLSNRKYVQLKGFTTFGGSIKMNDSEMCVLDGLDMSYLNHYIIGMDQHSGFIDDANTKNSSGAPARGEVGIYVGGKDNVIINNTMKYAAAAAIYGVGCNIYIENNVIKECGYAGSYVSGLYFTSEAWKDSATPRGGHSIYGNTVYRAGRAVIEFTRAAGDGLLPQLPSEIAFNDFHDGTLTSLDTGIVYAYWVLLGHEKQFTDYHHNFVYYTPEQQAPYRMGIFHDGGTQNVNIYNNVVFTTGKDTWFNVNSTESKETQVKKYSVWSANSVDSYAHCPKWNNSILIGVEGGPANLAESDFPDSRPFYAGAGQNVPTNTVNCNSYFAN